MPRVMPKRTRKPEPTPEPAAHWPEPARPLREIETVWRPTQRFSCQGVSFSPDVPVTDHELVRRILAEYPALFEAELLP
jgi:hypothetical protein